MLESSIRYLKGVGPKKEKVFNELGVYTIKDLLYYFPFRYEDRRDYRKIKDLKEGELAFTRVKVIAVKLKKIPYYVKRRVKSIFEIIAQDETGTINCVWFNQGYLADSIKANDEIAIYGKPKLKGSQLQYIAPEFEMVEDGDYVNLGKITGVYRRNPDINQNFIRKAITASLEYKNKLTEDIPFSIRRDNNLTNIVSSINDIHFPGDFPDLEAARTRFIFEELFFAQVMVYLRKAHHRMQQTVPITVTDKLINKIKDNIGFKLTGDQQKVLDEMADDLYKGYPMHRLIQGDVGCGKTVVSAFAIGACVDSGYQAAFMVPTEILTHQHKESLTEMFAGFNFNIEVLTSSLPKSKVKKIYDDLKTGKIDIIIGTHSLIQKDVEFKKLGLAVIDEQHKFGVAQRSLLPKKGIPNPHCLVMSATPIPRTLALSLYGDLDFSVIKELPPNRLTPKTQWSFEKDRSHVYEFIISQLKEGRQAFIVYPVIEESIDEDLKSLEVMYEKLVKEFSNYKVGMFHGRMKNNEKLEVVEKFKANKINLLVSTTVVEVGVNIPNATTMVVENPERFGLAQLHQLRGRIQRSSHQPHFILLSRSRLGEIAKKRLKIISTSNDGFKIAEEDLLMRGPGDFFGSMQSGIPDLRIANPIRDLEMMTSARNCAYEVVKSDPLLKKREHACMKANLSSWFNEDKIILTAK